MHSWQRVLKSRVDLHPMRWQNSIVFDAGSNAIGAHIKERISRYFFIVVCPHVDMVGVARLELTTPRSQSECATNCAIPRQIFFYFKRLESVTRVATFIFLCKCFSQKIGVNGGDRTLGHQSHNLVLYQLSYIHHIKDT
jgi:hypothetical protein